jgi:hypothetical protein
MPSSGQDLWNNTIGTKNLLLLYQRFVDFLPLFPGGEYPGGQTGVINNRKSNIVENP